MTDGVLVLIGIALIVSAIVGLINLATTYASWIFGGLLLLCVAGFISNGIRHWWLDHRQRREFQLRRREVADMHGNEYLQKLQRLIDRSREQDETDPKP